MRSGRSAFIVLLVAFPSLWAQTGPGSESVLTVEGNAQVRVVPDVAVVRLGVVDQAPTARQAQDGVNRVANMIVNALGAAQIEESAVQTSRLTLSPVYSRQRPNGNQPPSIIAYRAANTVTVRIGTIERIGEIIDAALEAGANQLEGVSFELEDDMSSRQASLRAAVGQARAKAEAIADALGVRLVSILSVNEGSVLIERPMMEMNRALALQQDTATPVSPGEVTVSASVTVRYRIESN